MKKIIKLYLSKKSLNFIRNLKFNFIGFILTFHLRFIKKSFLFIPHHHLKMMVILMDLIKVLDKLKIKYFIMSGTLLGAIRQSSFAGKPGDIDLAINISDLDKLNLYLNENKKKLSITQGPIVKDGTIWMRIKKETIDIVLFHNSRLNLVGKCFCYFKKKKIFLKLPKNSFIKRKKSNLYDTPIYVPKDYIYVIKSLYGNQWKKPNKKQYIWKNNLK